MLIPVSKIYQILLSENKSAKLNIINMLFYFPFILLISNAFNVLLFYYFPMTASVGTNATDQIHVF